MPEQSLWNKIVAQYNKNFRYKNSALYATMQNISA